MGKTAMRAAAVALAFALSPWMAGCAAAGGSGAQGGDGVVTVTTDEGQAQVILVDGDGWAAKASEDNSFQITKDGKAVAEGHWIYLPQGKGMVNQYLSDMDQIEVLEDDGGRFCWMWSDGVAQGIIPVEGSDLLGFSVESEPGVERDTAVEALRRTSAKAVTPAQGQAK